MQEVDPSQCVTPRTRQAGRGVGSGEIRQSRIDGSKPTILVDRPGQIVKHADREKRERLPVFGNATASRLEPIVLAVYFVFGLRFRGLSDAQAF